MARLAMCLLGLGAGCSSCEKASLQVAEPFAHTRCMAIEPPEREPWTVGTLRFALSGRELEIAGVPSEIRIAAFSGPALASAAGAREIAALSEREPTVAVMLGGLGDDDATASDTLDALSQAPFPTLFVPGGRDHAERIAAAFERRPEARKSVVNLAPVRLVRLGAHELVPVAGAADGRYALDGGSCGFVLSDLQAIAGELPPAGKSRYLLAWHAPGRGGAHAVASTPAGLDLGSDDLAEFAERVAAPGGLFGWPTARVAEPSRAGGARVLAPDEPARDLRVVVPRLTGRPLVTDGGARIPAGFLMLALDERGLRLLGRVEVP